MTSRPVLPAEWAPQSGIMLTWPHPGTDWVRMMDDVEPVFQEIARQILRFEHVLISCEFVSRLQKLGEQLNQWAEANQLPGRVVTVPAPADDTWARDHGPITVKTDDGFAVLDFQFNAWGNKFSWEKDNALNTHLAGAGVLGKRRLKPVEMVLEGGSVESNGEGTLMTTSECLLTPTRNPELDRTGVENALREHLGAERVLWLNHGYLAGDDTDSHIDTLARFCAPDHICYIACPDPTDEHYDALQAMQEELREFRQANGQPYRLTPLPWPDAIYDEDGHRLPATYANFLIINGAVLLPVYDVPQDEQAIQVLTELFPDREIIPVNCRALIHQHGSLHCLAMQLPKGVLDV